MKEVDGFTIIDYIKSSIEILMNMKIEENEGHSSHLYQSKKVKHKKHHNRFDEAGGNYILKIDDKTPTSSIVNLQ